MRFFYLLFNGRTMIDYARYPPNWPEIRARILERAEQQCECEGECGLHPGRRCEERNGTPAKWARGSVVLTIAHLDHDETNWQVRDERLRAMCQRCHLRYDQPRHTANARKTRLQKQGQLTLVLPEQSQKEEACSSPRLRSP